MPESTITIPASLCDDFKRDAYIYDLYDGDTVYYHADLGYNIWAAFQTGRLLSVWAAEVRPLVSREKGLQAKAYLEDLLDRYALNRDRPEEMQRLGRRFRIQTTPGNNKWFESIPKTGKGKYGRWLVTIFGCDNHGQVVNLNTLMVESGHATAGPETD